MIASEEIPLVWPLASSEVRDENPAIPADDHPLSLDLAQQLIY